MGGEAQKAPLTASGNDGGGETRTWNDSSLPCRVWPQLGGALHGAMEDCLLKRLFAMWAPVR